MDTILLVWGVTIGTICFTLIASLAKDWVTDKEE